MLWCEKGNPRRFISSDTRCCVLTPPPRQPSQIVGSKNKKIKAKN
jgi:hypothetical protein